MPDRLTRKDKEEYATKLTLLGVFVSIFAAFTHHYQEQRRGRAQRPISPMDLVLLGLSTLRLGRMVSYDLVTEPLRQPFTKTVPDPTGAGDTVEPREGSGFQRSLGQLIACPICTGTWVAAGLVYFFYSLPGPSRIFMTMMGTTGLAEILNALVENWSWSGQLARVRAGNEET